MNCGLWPPAPNLIEGGIVLGPIFTINGAIECRERTNQPSPIKFILSQRFDPFSTCGDHRKLEADGNEKKTGFESQKM